jgi:hypothetical protein
MFKFRTVALIVEKAKNMELNLSVNFAEALLMIKISSFSVLFLAMSTFFEFLCILLYAFVFPKLPIVKYYRSKAASEGSKTVSADLAAAGIQTTANNGVLQLFLNLILHHV